MTQDIVLNKYLWGKPNVGGRPESVSMRPMVGKARFVAVSLVGLAMLFSMCLGSPALEDEKAPDFTVLDTEDRAHNLTDYRGQVLVVEFFATWCGPCHSQLEELKDLRGRLPADRVAFLQIDSDDRESRSKVAQYVEDNDIPWPVAYNGGSVGADFNVDAIPTVAIIDGEGVVRFYNTGVVSADKLEERVDELL